MLSSNLTRLLSFAVLIPGLLASPKPTPTSPAETSGESILPTPLMIFMSEYNNTDEPPYQTWTFFETRKAGFQEGGCEDDEHPHQALPEPGSSDPRFGELKSFKNQHIMPGGTYNLKLYGEDCQFKCDGTNGGRLWCPSMPDNNDGAESVGCSQLQGNAAQYCDGYAFRAVSFCEWW